LLSQTRLQLVYRGRRYAAAVVFNLVNGTLVGTELARGGPHLTRPKLSTLMAGLALFWVGGLYKLGTS
jgi:hypothetical protein